MALASSIKDWGGDIGGSFTDPLEIMTKEYEQATKYGDLDKADKILQTLRRMQSSQPATPPKNSRLHREVDEASLADLMYNGAVCYPRFEDLNDSLSVHNMDVDSVKNIWTARFGSGWTKNSDTAEALKDDRHFWKQVFYKLRQNLDKCEYENEDGSRAYAWRLKEDHGNS